MKNAKKIKKKKGTCEKEQLEDDWKKRVGVRMKEMIISIFLALPKFNGNELGWNSSFAISTGLDFFDRSEWN